MGVLCVLPARLDSRRVPRKPLQSLAGEPLVRWTWEAASRVPGVDRVVIATDSEEIAGAARAFGAEAVLTSPGHRSGTERVAEAARSLGAAEDDVLVNFQADEPFADPATVGEAAAVAAGERDVISTVAAPIRTRREWRSGGIVKVVVTGEGRALYFSRAGVPHPRDAESGVPDFSGEAGTRFLRHVGVYACTRATLERWAALPESGLEQIEKLEQLRALEAGLPIRVVIGPATEPGIDLPEDLERAERLLGARAGSAGTGP